MGRGRPAEVFVRRLKPKEGRAVRRIVRRGKKDASPVTWRRALVVLMSAQRRSPAEIADAIDAKEGWVRGIIHAFNDAGMDALRPKWRGGRPRSITEDMRARIVEVAKTAPQLVGDPYTHWSLSKLASYLVKAGIVPTISKERLREILIEEGFSIQRTKTWKWSPDPEFAAKQKRLERLYERAVKGTLDGVVVSFDEHGPVQPIPKAGRAWAESEKPKRIPANYRKPHGVRFFFGAYDVGKDQLTGRWSRNKSAINVLSFFRWIRRRYPRQVRIYLVMDNLSSHWTDDVRSWAKDNNVVLVATPTYASWLNPIESQFGVMVDFVFSGSNYQGHNEIEQALSAYLKRRNAEARRNLVVRRAEKAKRQQRRRAARVARAVLAQAA